VARFGHESGFSPDGNTFYATATALPSITAIDVTDPKQPHAIWQGNILAHGMSLSDDGNRAYVADPTGGDMLILDTSQIQARKPNPQVREVSRLTWATASIPQNAIPFTENGHPYVLEFDEYTAGTLNPGASRDTVGAARIIDISDEAKPYVVANLRLQVNQPADHHAADGDPGTFSPAQGYAAHYCNIPTRVDPKIVACSFIASGLRVFDISQLTRPREIGYFVAPTKPNTETGYTESDYAMSQPAFEFRQARHLVHRWRHRLLRAPCRRRRLAVACHGSLGPQLSRVAARLPQGERSPRGEVARARHAEDDAGTGAPGLCPQLPARAAEHRLLLPDPDRHPRRLPLAGAAADAPRPSAPGRVREGGAGPDRQLPLRPEGRSPRHPAGGSGSAAARGRRIARGAEHLVHGASWTQPRPAQGQARGDPGGRHRRPRSPPTPRAEHRLLTSLD